MKTGNGSPDEIKIDLAPSPACVTGDILPFKPIKCTLNSILAKNNPENEHRYSHLSQFHTSAMFESRQNIFGALRQCSEVI